MIVDFFPFFAPYGKEILKLRVNLLKDHVDYFVISESNKTHAGTEVERKFLSIAKELNLPMEKIIYVPDDIPDNKDIIITDLDILNTYENYQKTSNADRIECQMARVRERMQKDALLSVLNKFDDDTVFIHSDMDEIINPIHIKYLENMCRNNQNVIIKIPLIYYECEADLRVYWKETNKPVDWSGGMFFATKAQLKNATPTQIRSNVKNPYSVVYITENDNIIKDLGWHFSWMGGPEKRKVKSKSWAHYNDSFSWSNFNKFSDDSYLNFTEENVFDEGQIPPSGNKNYILKKYPRTELPELILSDEELCDFFLPTFSKTKTKNVKKDWGFYKDIHQDGTHTKIRELTINPGKSLNIQRHSLRSEQLMITNGVASIYQGFDYNNLRKLNMEKHDQIHIIPNEWYQIKNETTDVLNIIEIQYGKTCDENDIETIV